MEEKMLHKMKLQEDPFERIKNGTKTVEFRLYDEKRRTIQIGDEIEFSKLPELQEKLLVKVIDLYKEESFEKLFKKVFVGEDKEKIIEKEDLPSTKGCSQQNSYEIIDGILHFKSPEAMSTLVNVLEKMSDEEFFA